MGTQSDSVSIYFAEVGKGVGAKERMGSDQSFVLGKENCYTSINLANRE